MPFAPGVVWFRNGDGEYIAWNGTELNVESLSILERITKIGDTALEQAGWDVYDITPLMQPGPNKFATIGAAPDGIPVRIEMRADPAEPSSKPQRGVRSIVIWMNGEKVFEVR